MKEECKNCAHARPTYKGVWCEMKDKRVKTRDTCEDFKGKR